MSLIQTKFIQATCSVGLALVLWLQGSTVESVACSRLEKEASIVKPIPTPISLVLFQLNDVYQPDPVDQGAHGGLARVASLLKKERQQVAHSRFILAGDTLSPSVQSKVFHGAQMIAAWNQLGLDLATLGNHEFDFGPENLKTQLAASHFQWVVSNVRERETGHPLPHTVETLIQEFEGVKVGFFGLLTPDTVDSSHPGKGIEITDPIEAARRVIPELRAQGATVIIGITHLPLALDKQLAQKMVGENHVDLILGGHEHVLLQTVAAGTPIFKVGSDARQLGKIVLSLNSETKKLDSIDWSLLPIDASLESDEGFLESQQPFQERLKTLFNETIGETEVMLDARQQANRSQETNLGNLIADAYRASLKTDIALVNGGAIRTDTTIPPGRLTELSLLQVMPFENQVVTIRVTGEVLKQALENAVSLLDQGGSGRFLHVSGLQFHYTLSRPVGERVSQLLIHGAPPLPNKTYTVALTRYLAEGGDGFEMFRGHAFMPPPKAIEVGRDKEQELLVHYIRLQKRVAPKVEGRIVRE